MKKSFQRGFSIFMLIILILLFILMLGAAFFGQPQTALILLAFNAFLSVITYFLLKISSTH